MHPELKELIAAKAGSYDTTQTAIEAWNAAIEAFRLELSDYASDVDQTEIDLTAAELKVKG